MSHRTILLICDTPSRLAQRIENLAAQTSVSLQKMSSDELAVKISIYRSGTSLEVSPENSAILLSASCADPDSFDDEFLAQEKETTIRAWALMNSRKVFSFINLHNNDLSAEKTSCAVLEREFGLPCRREVYALQSSLTRFDTEKMWFRDSCGNVVIADSEVKILPNAGGPSSEPIWGRSALGSGHFTAFLVIGDWCETIRIHRLSAELLELTKKIATRLEMSCGFFVWWIEEDSGRAFLVKTERTPPEYVSDDIIDRFIQHMFEALS